MRLLLIVLIAIVAFALIQHYRHGCNFEEGWFDCVLGRTATTTTTPTTGEAPSTPESPAPAETPAQ